MSSNTRSASRQAAAQAAAQAGTLQAPAAQSPGSTPPPPPPSPPRSTGSNDTHEEPRPEPPTNVGEDGNDAGKQAGRIDLKNVKISQFDGSVKSGEFDSNVKDWWEELRDQVQDAQLLANQTWSDDVKKSVLKLFLTGMARRWFRRWRSDHANASFEQAGSALVAAFRVRLTDQEITQRVYSEKKRWSETYREYADRLLVMTDTLEGGNSFAFNARHALNTFIRLAYPNYANVLKGRIDQRATDPLAELDRAVETLTEVAETDGRARANRPKPPTKPERSNMTAKRPQPQGKGRDAKPSKNPKKRAAQAQAAVVERKKKKPANTVNNRRASFTCYECGQNGHTAAYHRKYLSGKDASESNQAQANQAADDSMEADSEDSE